CDDFDENPLATGWDEIIQVRGTAALDTSLWTSSPHSMLATTQSTTNASFDVHAGKTFSSLGVAAIEMTLAFDFRIETFNSSSDTATVLGTIALIDTTGTEYDLEIVVEEASSTTLSILVAEDTTPGDGGANVYAEHTTSTKVKSKTWTHAVL